MKGRDHEKVEAATQDYLRQRETFVKLARKVEERCRLVLKGAIRANYQSRAKTTDSFSAKLTKRLNGTDHEPVVAPNEAVTLLRDLAGVRILTYDEDSRRRASELLVKEFEGIDGGQVSVDHKDDDPEKFNPKVGKFYRSTHLEVFWPRGECTEDDLSLRDLPCEIQITSLLAHVWNEIEHDITYKPDSGQASESQSALLKILGGLAVAGDDVLNELLRKESSSPQPDTAPFSDPFDFGHRLASLYPSLNLPDGRTGQLFEVVAALGLCSPKALLKAIPASKLGELADAIDSYNSRLLERNDTRLLNTDDSDVIAFALAQSKGNKILEQFPDGRGTGVPLRVVRVARHLSMDTDK